MSSFKQQKGSYGNRQATNETQTPPSHYNFVTQANQLQYLQTQSQSHYAQPSTPLQLSQLSQLPQLPQLPHHFPSFDPSLPSEYASMQNLTEHQTSYQSAPNQSTLQKNSPIQKPQTLRDIKRQHYLRKKRIKNLLLNDDLKNLS